LGNDSSLSLSTTAATVTGTLAVSSTLTAPIASVINPSVGFAINTTSNWTASAENNPILTFGRAGAAVAGSLGYDDLLASLFLGTTSNHKLLLKTNNTTRLTVDTSGNVGIGTSAPAASLQVGQDTTANSLTGKSIIYGAGQDLTGTPVEILTLSRPFNAGVSFLGAASLCVAKDTANANSRAAKLSIKLSDNADATDFVAASFTKNGLCFNSDTAAANALDDYEEGTWTMGVSFGGASVDVTTSSNTGTYTKIGRQVTVNGYLALSSKGSSTGIAIITGLPFALANTNGNYSAVSLRVNGITFLNQFQGFGDIGQTYIVLNEITEAGVSSNLTNADFANDSDVMLSLTYFV
jgi:hypothetical protein